MLKGSLSLLYQKEMHKSPDVISLKKLPLAGAPGSDSQL